MSNLEPTIRINVDVTNPGQFFACCGLLELAHRLWPTTEGWFDAGRFLLSVPSVTDTEIIGTCLTVLRKCILQADDSRGKDAVHPIRITYESHVDLMLDWWIDQNGNKGPFKLWAGQQTSLRIMQALRNALPSPSDISCGELFDQGAALTGRFGVDPRAAWNALDSGFSPNTQHMEVYSYPAVELLAAVGLQGFRPREIIRETRQHAYATQTRTTRSSDQQEIARNPSWQYATWSSSLPSSVARVASAGIVSTGRTAKYRFEIAARGSYKGFRFAISTIGDES